MRKWLVGGGAALLALLLLLWHMLATDDARAAVAPRARAAAPAATSSSTVARLPVVPTAVAQVAPAAPAAVEQPGKLNPASDEFFWRFDEVVPKVLTRNAAKCYEGRHGSLHRNQKLSLKFKVKVVSGEVHVEDVTIKESTLGDAALEACFIQQVQRSTWKDDELPDVGVDDELVLRPERGMKKYWRDNVEYVGAEAPRD